LKIVEIIVNLELLDLRRVKEELKGIKWGSKEKGGLCFVRKKRESVRKENILYVPVKRTNRVLGEKSQEQGEN